MAAWKEWVMDLLFPPKCIFCGALTETGMVCSKCAAELPETGSDALRDLGGGLHAAAPLYYEGAVRESLLRFKFHGADHYAKGYGPYLARTAALEFADRFDLVSWVPVSKKRRRERGYDQAELLAAEVSRLWAVKPVRTLEKTVHNPAQSGIASPEQRRANVLGVYEAVNRAEWSGKRILLVDDILTTGSTLSEAARTLRFAGAEEVVCLTLAAVREKDDNNVMVTK